MVGRFGAWDNTLFVPLHPVPREREGIPGTAPCGEIRHQINPSARKVLTIWETDSQRFMV
jgi:hypothetical protein